MNQSKQRAARDRRILTTFAHAVVAIVAVLLLGVVFGSPDLGTSLCALPVLGAFGIPTILRTPDKGGATGTAEFEEQMIGEVKNLRQATEQKYDELHKSTKQTTEELAKIRDSFSGLGADVQAAQATLKKLQAQLLGERRMAFGDPIARIAQDEEKRNLFNALVRSAVGKRYGGIRLSEAQQKALDTANTPGSAYINQELFTDVYDVLATYGIWNTFDVRQLSTKTNLFPVKTARAAAAFLTSEGGTISGDSTKAGTSVTATVATAAVLLTASMELVEDSEIDISRDVLDDFAQSIASKMDWACTQADGGADATDGGFTGIFGGGGTAVNAATGNTTMETLDFEDWTSVVIAAAAIADRQLKWWMHPAILVRALHTKDSNGRPIFLTANEAPAPGNIGSILGYPIVPSHQAPSTNSAGAKVAVLGDPKGAVFGVRKAFEFAASYEAGFADYEVVFRGIARFAFKVRSATAFRVLTTAAS